MNAGEVVLIVIAVIIGGAILLGVLGAILAFISDAWSH